MFVLKFALELVFIVSSVIGALCGGFPPVAWMQPAVLFLR